MSELQNDSVESEVIEPAVNENPDNGAELATDSDAQHETQAQVETVDDKQAKFDEAFNKQYGKRKQAEREAEQYKQRLEELERAEREREAASMGSIPDLPDPFDDNYETRLREREQAIAVKAEWDAKNKLYLEQQQQERQRIEQAQQQAQAEILERHNSRVKALGIDQTEMINAENAVLAYGIDPNLVQHIASLDDSPNIIRYLAANPQEGYNLATANPYIAGESLRSISEKAQALKPKPTAAPPPSERLAGNGVDPELGKYQFSGGAKFE